MSDNYVNQADFARKIPVQPQAITNAINKGQLIKHGNGRSAYIDMDCPLTVAYIRNASVNRYKNKVGGSVRPPRKPQGKTAPPLPLKKAQEQPPSSPEAIASVEAFTDKQEIERLKKLEETEALRIKNRKSRGELLERETVQGFINTMYVVDNGQWRTLGLRASSDIAALLGIDDDDKIRDISDEIDKSVFKTLKQVKREMNKFLKRIEGKPVPKENIDLGVVYKEMADMLKSVLNR